MAEDDPRASGGPDLQIGKEGRNTIADWRVGWMEKGLKEKTVDSLSS